MSNRNNIHRLKVLEFEPYSDRKVRNINETYNNRDTKNKVDTRQVLTESKIAKKEIVSAATDYKYYLPAKKWKDIENAHKKENMTPIASKAQLDKTYNRIKQTNARKLNNVPANDYAGQVTQKQTYKYVTDFSAFPDGHFKAEGNGNKVKKYIPPEKSFYKDNLVRIEDNTENTVKDNPKTSQVEFCLNRYTIKPRNGRGNKPIEICPSNTENRADGIKTWKGHKNSFSKRSFAAKQPRTNKFDKRSFPKQSISYFNRLKQVLSSDSKKTQKHRRQENNLKFLFTRQSFSGPSLENIVQPRRSISTNIFGFRKSAESVTPQVYIHQEYQQIPFKRFPAARCCKNKTYLNGQCYKLIQFRSCDCQTKKVGNDSAPVAARSKIQAFDHDDTRFRSCECTDEKLFSAYKDKKLVCEYKKKMDEKPLLNDIPEPKIEGFRPCDGKNIDSSFISKCSDKKKKINRPCESINRASSVICKYTDNKLISALKKKKITYKCRKKEKKKQVCDEPELSPFEFSEETPKCRKKVKNINDLGSLSNIRISLIGKLLYLSRQCSYSTNTTKERKRNVNGECTARSFSKFHKNNNLSGTHSKKITSVYEKTTRKSNSKSMKKNSDVNKNRKPKQIRVFKIPKCLKRKRPRVSNVSTKNYWIKKQGLQTKDDGIKCYTKKLQTSSSADSGSRNKKNSTRSIRLQTNPSTNRVKDSGDNTFNYYGDQMSPKDEYNLNRQQIKNRRIDETICPKRQKLKNNYYGEKFVCPKKDESVCMSTEEIVRPKKQKNKMCKSCEEFVSPKKQKDEVFQSSEEIVCPKKLKIEERARSIDKVPCLKKEKNITCRISDEIFYPKKQKNKKCGSTKYTIVVRPKKKSDGSKQTIYRRKLQVRSVNILGSSCNIKRKKSRSLSKCRCKKNFFRSHNENLSPWRHRNKQKTRSSQTIICSRQHRTLNERSYKEKPRRSYSTCVQCSILNPQKKPYNKKYPQGTSCKSNRIKYPEDKTTKKNCNMFPQVSIYSMDKKILRLPLLSIKYVLVFLIILLWLPCILAVSLCWLVTYPMRPRSSTSQPFRTSFSIWVRKANWNNQCILRLIKRMLKSTPRGVVLCSASSIPCNSYSSSRMHKTKRKKLALNPNNEYTLSHYSARGWVAKSTLNEPESNKKSSVFGDIRRMFNTKTRNVIMCPGNRISTGQNAQRLQSENTVLNPCWEYTLAYCTARGWVVKPVPIDRKRYYGRSQKNFNLLKCDIPFGRVRNSKRSDWNHHTRCTRLPNCLCNVCNPNRPDCTKCALVSKCKVCKPNSRPCTPTKYPKTHDRRNEQNYSKMNKVHNRQCNRPKSPAMNKPRKRQNYHSVSDVQSRTVNKVCSAESKLAMASCHCIRKAKKTSKKKKTLRKLCIERINECFNPHPLTSNQCQNLYVKRRYFRMYKCCPNCLKDTSRICLNSCRACLYCLAAAIWSPCLFCCYLLGAICCRCRLVM